MQGSVVVGHATGTRHEGRFTFARGRSGHCRSLVLEPDPVAERPNSAVQLSAEAAVPWLRQSSRWRLGGDHALGYL